MSDFMDTALNYQPGVRVEPNAKRWVLTNGIGRIPVCDVCAQPIYEGHIDCTCDKNHPAICQRPTYNQLKAQSKRWAARYAEVVAALESSV